MASCRPRRQRVSSRRISAALVVLAAGSGASDVFSLATLTHVFTSVMTGNLVLLGLGAGSGDSQAVARPVVALAAFAGGVFVTARLLRPVRVSVDDPWPSPVTTVLGLGLVSQLGALAIWIVTRAEPAPGVSHLMVVLLGWAMGVQTAAVNTIRVPGAATTYLTGTLARLVAHVATRGARATMRREYLEVLALLGGAVIAGVLVLLQPLGLGILPAAATLGAILIMRGRRPERSSRRGEGHDESGGES